MAEITAPQSSLKALIAKGKEQTYLTYAEVNDHLPESISDPDQVEDIIQMINDMGIKVFETAPDADALLLNEENDSGADEVAAAEAAAALAAVENEAGRTTDPVRMYMREMGTVELLTREGEIVIAKRIEEGLRELMKAMAFFPGTVEHILNEYALIDTEERRLNEVITGYLDTSDDEIPVSPGIEEPSDEADTDLKENDDDDDERRHELRHVGEEVRQPVHALVDAAHELKMLGIVASLVHWENGNASAQHGETHDCKHGDDERRVRVFSLRDVALLQFEHVARVKMYPRLERHVARAST